MRQKRQWNLQFASAEEPTRQERNTIMELPMAAGTEATDMVRVGRSGVYRLIAAGEDQDRPPQRPSVAPIRHLAGHGAALKVKMQRPGESPTSEHSGQVGDVLAA
jgi:hypothetical protein